MKLVLDKGVCNAIKLLSAILICLHHYSQYVCELGTTNVIYKALSTQGGYLGVAIFFFLSGFGMMESETKRHLRPFQFLKKRLTKIYLPAVLITALWLPTLDFASKSGINIAALGGGNSHIIKRLLFSFADPAMWYIRATLILYCLFYIFALLKRKNIKVALVCLSIFAVISTVFIYLTFANYAAISIPIFFIGVFASIYKEKHLGICNVVSVAALIVSILEAIALFAMHSPYAFIAHAVFNYIAIALLIEIFTIKNIRWRVPAFIGAISFDIYLVHNKVLMLLWAMYDFVPLYGVITITLVSSLVFYLLRTKLLKLK